MKCLSYDGAWGDFGGFYEMHKPEDADSCIILIDAECRAFEQKIREIANDEKLCKTVAIFNLPSDVHDLDQFLSIGIQGFFYKSDSISLFTKGMGAICRGEVWAPRAALSRYVKSNHMGNSPGKVQKTTLTARETEVLTLLSSGADNNSIADKLCISNNTVKTHLYKIFKKIDVPNRFQAAIWAAKNL